MYVFTSFVHPETKCFSQSFLQKQRGQVRSDWMYSVCEDTFSSILFRMLSCWKVNRNSKWHFLMPVMDFAKTQVWCCHDAVCMLCLPCRSHHDKLQMSWIQPDLWSLWLKVIATDFVQWIYAAPPDLSSVFLPFHKYVPTSSTSFTRHRMLRCIKACHPQLTLSELLVRSNLKNKQKTVLADKCWLILSVLQPSHACTLDPYHEYLPTSILNFFNLST